MNFNNELAQRQQEIEQIIKGYLPEEKGYQKLVIEAMNYSLLSGGKRIRPMLMQETYRLFGGTGNVIKPFMAALEMIHTYSLVHDDLPSMDNDDYRRGRETTHKVFGEGMAILAGDGLLNYAFETAASAFTMAASLEEMQAAAQALTVLGQKSGIHGMIGGQTADILSENPETNVTEDLLLFIHKNKTAALVQSAMMIGAILAGATKEEVSKMEVIACNIGLAFQIQDDILDVEGSFQELGKSLGSDEKNNKLTFVRMHSIEAAKNRVKELTNESRELLTEVTLEGKYKSNEFLILLLESLVSRKK